MEKYLNGSAETGRKIIQNWSDFKVEFIGDNDEVYKFTWEFYNQYGYINIRFKKGKILESSLIDTDNNSPNGFDRPLGLYNDPSLYHVFERCLKEI